MSNFRPSFPVSGSQGMGNRETGANALANHDLESPRPLKPKRGRGKQKAGHASIWDSTGRPTASPVPFLTIDRLYRPQSTAMEALEDVLQLLGVDAQESPDPPSSWEPESTFFPRGYPSERCVAIPRGHREDNGRPH
jgi:hypothetical protein